MMCWLPCGPARKPLLDEHLKRLEKSQKALRAQTTVEGSLGPLRPESANSAGVYFFSVFSSRNVALFDPRNRESAGRYITGDRGPAATNALSSSVTGAIRTLFDPTKT